MTKDEELKPCPFCGSQNVSTTQYFDEYGNPQNDWLVQCDDCLAGFLEPTDTETEAIAKWNKRSSKNDTDEELTAWVSVKERLPEESGLYLVAIDWVIPETGDGGRNSDIVWFNNSLWHTNYEYETVTLWQPLPEPPKETK